jgi:hypothetical protein
MRQIKFRAWYPKEKVWLDGVEVYHDGSWMGEIIRPDHADIGYCEKDGCILEQFTGLLDKNGKEIYEGDILKSDTYKVVWVIFWNDTSVRFEVKDANGLLPAELCYINLQIHYVIGNIHENPELLK